MYTRTWLGVLPHLSVMISSVGLTLVSGHRQEQFIKQGKSNTKEVEEVPERLEEKAQTWGWIPTGTKTSRLEAKGGIDKRGC